MTTEVDAMPWLLLNAGDDDWRDVLQRIAKDPDVLDVYELEDGSWFVRERDDVDPLVRARRARQKRFRDKRRGENDARRRAKATRDDAAEPEKMAKILGSDTPNPLGFGCVELPKSDASDARRDDADDATRDDASLIPTDDEKAAARAAIDEQRERWRAEGRDPYAHRRLRRRT